jgi:aminopeptidase N
MPGTNEVVGDRLLAHAKNISFISQLCFYNTIFNVSWIVYRGLSTISFINSEIKKQTKKMSLQEQLADAQKQLFSLAKKVQQLETKYYEEEEKRLKELKISNPQQAKIEAIKRYGLDKTVISAAVNNVQMKLTAIIAQGKEPTLDELRLAGYDQWEQRNLMAFFEDGDWL